MVLSKRLTAVTDLMPAGNIIADVGCDHGYISINLIESGKFKKAVAMDVRKGPLSIAKDNIARVGLNEKIESRLSDGLAGVALGEADAAIIAGMGGLLVIGILERSIEKAKAMTNLVLQPQSDINLVRKFLRENGFIIKEENMIKEDGKFYPMFLVSYADLVNSSENTTSALDNMQIEEKLLQDVCDYYGPELIKSNNEVLLEYVKHEKEVLESVLVKLPENNIDRINEIKYKIELNSICMNFFSDNGDCK